MQPWSETDTVFIGMAISIALMLPGIYHLLKLVMPSIYSTLGIPEDELFAGTPPPRDPWFVRVVRKIPNRIAWWRSSLWKRSRTLVYIGGSIILIAMMVLSGPNPVFPRDLAPIQIVSRTLLTAFAAWAFVRSMWRFGQVFAKMTRIDNMITRAEMLPDQERAFKKQFKFRRELFSVFAAMGNVMAPLIVLVDLNGFLDGRRTWTVADHLWTIGVVLGMLMVESVMGLWLTHKLSRQNAIRPVIAAAWAPTLEGLAMILAGIIAYGFGILVL